MESEKVLFEEAPGEDRTYRNGAMLSAILCLVGSACFLVIAVMAVSEMWGVLSVEYIGIGAAVVGFFLLFAAACASGAVSVLYSRRQFLRIYRDRIVYRKPFQKNEQVLCLRPDEYKIKLHRSAVIWGNYPSKFVTKLIFWDENGKKLFSYKAPTFHGSPYQSPRRKCEDELLALGCEILDPEEVIINK